MPTVLPLLVVPLLLAAKAAPSQGPSVATGDQDMNATQQDLRAGRLAAAEGKLNEALQLAEAFPPDDRRRVSVLHQLADVYHLEGKDESAEDLLEEELEIGGSTA